MARKPRDLRPDELELWRRVVEHAEPMHPAREAPVQDARPTPLQNKTKPTSKPRPPWPTPQPFKIGESVTPGRPGHDLAPPIADHVRSAPVRMDRKRFGKMIKGRLIPEARIDLHGMTLDQAHPALNRFIFDAVADGCRLVLVITGKGKLRDELGPMPQRLGVLRHQVPHWLHSMPLKPYVLQISEAHEKHGGAGAYYVYLRRG